jgi:hypothetical protein
MHWADNWNSYLADEMVFEAFCIQEVCSSKASSLHNLVPDCLLFLGLMWQVMKNGHIATVTLFQSHV